VPISFASSYTLTLDPGELRTEIVIEEMSTSAGDTGEEVETWSDASVPVMARIETIGGGEFVFADRMEARATHRVTLRYIDLVNVDATMRVRLVEAGTYLNILLVNNVQMRDVILELLCKEGR
jgi:SPP1 family predicted phage head-tail adaptor